MPASSPPDLGQREQRLLSYPAVRVGQRARDEFDRAFTADLAQDREAVSHNEPATVSDHLLDHGHPGSAHGDHGVHESATDEAIGRVRERIRDGDRHLESDRAAHLDELSAPLLVALRTEPNRNATRDTSGHHEVGKSEALLVVTCFEH
jgi:hypothetical protein